MATSNTAAKQSEPLTPATNKQNPKEMAPLPPTAVCVPLSVDAFILNEAVCNSGKAFIAPFSLPDYSALGPGIRLQHDVIPHLDMRTAYPASINTRIADLDTGTPRIDRLGVYLHWAVPQPFRAGLAATDSGQEMHKSLKEAKGLPDTDHSPQGKQSHTSLQVSISV
jgi:hypothetical protein